MTKIKKGTISAIVTVALSGNMGLVATGGMPVNLQIGDNNHWYTKNKYNEIKNELMIDYYEDGVIGLDKMKLFGAILDKEIKAGNKIIAKKTIKKITK